jgi:hypothetical protein
MRWMREEVRHQKYRYDPRSPDWVGLALAKHLGLDPRADPQEAQRHTTGMVCQRCTSSGNPKTGVRHERKYVVPGNWNDDPDAA